MELLSKTNIILQAGLFERVVSLWPFLIILVLLLLGFLWYNQVRQMRRGRDRQDRNRMTGVINPIILLGIVTLLILLLLALPFFFERLEEAMNEKEKDEVLIDPKNLINETLEIKGMESPDCEAVLKDRLDVHYGIKMAEISFIDKKATILFDTTLVSLSHIYYIIEASGFEAKTAE